MAVMYNVVIPDETSKLAESGLSLYKILGRKVRISSHLHSWSLMYPNDLADSGVGEALSSVRMETAQLLTTSHLPASKNPSKPVSQGCDTCLQPGLCSSCFGCINFCCSLGHPPAWGSPISPELFLGYVDWASRLLTITFHLLLFAQHTRNCHLMLLCNNNKHY